MKYRVTIDVGSVEVEVEASTVEQAGSFALQQLNSDMITEFCVAETEELTEE